MPAAVLTIDINARLASLEAAVAKIPGAFRNSTKGVETELDRIGKKLSAFGSSALAGIGVPLGGAAALAFLSTLTQKAAEAERSTNQLNAVLKNTASGLTKGGIDELSQGIQARTVFDDDAINAAATALLRFRKIQGDTFREALQLAPDVAAALGVDLTQAAQLLGRALTEPESEIKAFKVAGVALSEQLRDTTADMMQTGNVAGAQAIRLNEIKRAIGGSADADNTGVYGATKRFGRAWDDMLKLLGKGISGNGGWVSALAEQLDRINKSLASSPQSLGQLFEIVNRRNPIAVAADIFRGRDIRTGGVGVSGRIRGIKTAEEEAAEARAEAERERQLEEQRYLDRKANLQRLAAATAATNQERLIRLKATLDTESTLYEQAYRHNEIAIKEFYDTQRRSADVASQATLKALADEGEAIEKQHAEATGPNRREERLALEQQLRGVAVRTAQAQAEAQQKLVGISVAETEAVRRLKDEYEDLGIKLAELRGDDVEAANRAFVQGNKELLARITAQLQSGDTGAQERAAAALAEYNATARLVDVRSRLADALKNYSLTVDELALGQERISIAEQTGAVTSIGALERRSALNAQYVEILTEELAIMEKIARESGRREDVVKVEQLRVQIQALAAQTDLLADKFREMGTGEFSQLLQGLANAPRDWRNVLDQSARSFSAQLNRVAADTISQTAFGKGGVFEGFGGFFAKIFGGKELAGTAVVQTQITQLGTASSVTKLAFDAVTSAANSAAAALARVGGGGGGDFFSSLFGGSSGFGGPDPGFISDSPFTGPNFGTYDVGTPFVPRDGWAKLQKGERVITSADNASGRFGHGRGGMVQNVNITLNTGGAPMDARTQRNLIRDMRLALANNGARG